MGMFRDGKVKDSLTAASFGLFIEKELVGTFRKCTGLSSKNEVIKEVKVKEGKTVVQKQPGGVTVGDVTLERGVTDSLDLYEWRQLILDGKINANRRPCSIVVYAPNEDPVARYELYDCWPAEFSGGDLDASSNDVFIEKVVLAVERMERVKP